MHRRIAICKIVITGISTTFNVSIYRISQCIAIIGCIDLNNMTNRLIILKVQAKLLSLHCNRIGLKEKVGLFCKKILEFLHYSRIAIYRCSVIFLGQCIIQILYRISTC